MIMYGNLVSIGQHFVITRVVHLPKRTETSLITLVSDLITESDQAVRAVHSCNSWLFVIFINSVSYTPSQTRRSQASRAEMRKYKSSLMFLSCFVILIMNKYQFYQLTRHPISLSIFTYCNHHVTLLQKWLN